MKPVHESKKLMLADSEDATAWSIAQGSLTRTIDVGHVPGEENDRPNRRERFSTTGRESERAIKGSANVGAHSTEARNEPRTSEARMVKKRKQRGGARPGKAHGDAWRRGGRTVGDECGMGAVCVICAG
jgi:hypothetical protein